MQSGLPYAYADTRPDASEIVIYVYLQRLQFIYAFYLKNKGSHPLWGEER